MKLLALSALICALMAPTLAGKRLGVLKRTLDDDWTTIGDSDYLCVPEQQTWSEAEQHCSSLGGHLASVHSECEYHIVQYLIRTGSRELNQTWIGGNDQDEEGVWDWTDGTTFNYTDWCEGEPNNGAGNSQNCLQINYSSNKCWDDFWCDEKLPSVCVRTSKS